jgi:hypothetical protein
VKRELGLLARNNQTTARKEHSARVKLTRQGTAADVLLAAVDWEKMKDSTPALKKYISYDEDGSNSSIAKAVGIVDCSCEEALAWVWGYCSYERNKE